MDTPPADQKRPHSAEYFNDTRDFWWNLDFLALMAQRLDFAQVRGVLDVGSGVGHWGRALARVLPEQAVITGVDREEQWVRQAGERAAQAGLGSRFTYQQGDANALPFPDGTFDLVTCQTVLMHLPDARVGLREMLRVTKPGGLVLAVEPSNIASIASFTSVTDALPTDTVLDLLRLHLTCQRGKRALGEGFNCLGDLLPGYMAALGAMDIRVYMSDRAVPMYPPYTLPHQQAERKLLQDWHARERWIWDRAETQRLYLAGGGNAADFLRLWQIAGMQMGAELAGMEAGTYHAANPGVTFLVSGRKPS